MTTEIAPLEIIIVPCLKDNYAYLVKAGAQCAVVDPSEPGPVNAALKDPTALGLAQCRLALWGQGCSGSSCLQLARRSSAIL